MNDFSKLTVNHSYDSGVEDVLWDFYIPVLSRANKYDRIAGFFNSSSLAITAKGMSEFIMNGGTMRLVTCPELSQQDISILEQTDDALGRIMLNSFIEDYSKIESQFQKDHVRALGWMLANARLDMRIAVLKSGMHILSGTEVRQSGIMHQKVGILYDQSGNILSFSGSNNESLSGWMSNTEEFKVFYSWDNGYPYYKDDIEKFDSFWNGTRKDVEIKKIPEALKEELIKVSQNFEPQLLDVRRYYPARVITQKEKEELKLFSYQKEAVEKWEKNSRKLLLEMATGCGKTRTAIGCMQKAIKDTDKLLVVISTPQATLSAQWHSDIDNLDVDGKYNIEINGTISGWDVKLKKELMRLKVGQIPYLIVYVTHSICSADKFTNIISDLGEKVTKFLIGDEVHGLGAEKMRKALLPCYDFRLGLSATPQRWFDDIGSEIIRQYFGDDAFVFSITGALTQYNPLTQKHFLVQYTYHPRFINLTDEELEEYQKLTLRLVRSSAYMDDDTYVQMLRFQRANIEKNAYEKYGELEKILDELGNSISDTIIFVSDEQIDRVMKRLGDRGITATRYTKDCGTAKMEKYGGKTEREYIIDLFKEKQYQVLVAIKCLDEGIDIPSADTAIVMASSTNPREYVQRIGRVIRQSAGKTQANIYDLILKPDFKAFRDKKMQEMEKRIFNKELDRVLDLSKNAINNTTVLNEVYEIKMEASS